jgi:hypothetical protein
MNTMVNAERDVAIPIGNIIKELEQHKRSVKLNYPILENRIGKTYTVDEVYDECCNILNNYYGCDVRKLKR